MNLDAAALNLIHATTGETYPVQLLDDTVPKVAVGTRDECYSRSHRVYGCDPTKFGLRCCLEIGSKRFAVSMPSGEVVNVWLCAICRFKLGLQNDIILFEEGVETEVVIWDNVRQCEVTVTVIGGCRNLLTMLIGDSHIDVRVRYPAVGDEMVQQMIDWVDEGLITVRRPGRGRGCEHYASHDWLNARNILETNDEVKSEFHETEVLNDGRFYAVIPHLYGESLMTTYNRTVQASCTYLFVVSFMKHCDRIYAGKPTRRNNWTQLDYSSGNEGIENGDEDTEQEEQRDEPHNEDTKVEEEETHEKDTSGVAEQVEIEDEVEEDAVDSAVEGLGDAGVTAEDSGDNHGADDEDFTTPRVKVTRLSCRRSGEYVDIVCRHGTIFDMDHFAAGIEDQSIEHAIFNGTNTMTITYDHGVKESETITDEMLLAAWNEFFGDVLVPLPTA